MTRAVVALGSNEGDRLRHLQYAVGRLQLAEDVAVVAVSPVVETEPVGGPEQPDYLNAVVLVDTTLSAGQLLALAHQIEAESGRRRDVRWGPRTLDVDLITVGAMSSDDPALTLPHPRAHERAFVLVPWAALDPAAELPGHGRVDELVTTVDRAGVRTTTRTLEVPA
jgi:2-amino-4-hydroxy-6-hydroxymethyldihydropteridine diphosphokinase